MSLGPITELTDEIIDEGWENKSNLERPILYHYTDSAGLIGLLSSSYIFATDSRFLNDSMESKIGLEMAESVVRDMATQTKENFHTALAQSLSLPSPNPNFVFSLSFKEDDLSQWRSYASEGSGFTIGFDASVIYEWSKNGKEFSFGPVSYNARTFERKVRRAVDRFYRYSKSLYEADVNNTVDACDIAISSLACAYKHSSFKSEGEWRINTYADEDDEVCVRNGKNGLLPYLKIQISSEGESLPIRKIGIGPGFKDNAIKYAVERLCAQHSVEAEIYNADTPFRRV